MSDHASSSGRTTLAALSSAVRFVVGFTLVAVASTLTILIALLLDSD